MIHGRRYCLILVGIIILSLFGLRPLMSSVETYKSCMKSIDKRKDEVMKISASSAASAALITVLPEDWANPIAEELADLTSTFLIVLAILYSEKYLLPIIGYIVSVFLIPGSCILGMFYILKPNRVILKQIAIRILILAIVSVLIVPTSIWISDSIETTFKDTISDLERKALDGEKTLMEENANNQEDSQNIFQKIGGAISKVWKDVTEGAKSLLHQAKDLLAYYTELIAVHVVTDCIIPVLVLFSYAMLIKYIFKLSYTMTDVSNQLKSKKRKMKGAYMEHISFFRKDKEDEEDKNRLDKDNDLLQ